MATILFILSYILAFLLSMVFINPYLFLLWLLTSYAVGFLTVVVFYLLNFPAVLILRPTHPYKTYLMKSLANFLNRFVLNLKVQIFGLENIPKNKPTVAYANHKSYTDAFALIQFFSRPITLTPKKSVLKIPFLKWWLKAYNVFPINRSNPKETLQDLNNAVKTVQNGQVVLLFPEGSIKDRLKEKMENAKAGSFRLAKQAQAEILPIRYEGNDLVRNRWPRKTVRTITILPVISYEEIAEKSTQDIARLFMDKINQK